MGTVSRFKSVHTRVKLIATAIFLAVVLVIWIVYHTYSLITPPSLIYIPPKSSQHSLLSVLRAQNVPLNIIDYRLLRRYPYPASGWVRFDPSKKISREEFLQELGDQQRQKSRRIVMFGGEALEFFATRTAKQTRLKASDIIKQYHAASPFEDGGIMAGYYQIPYRTNAEAMIYYMHLKSIDRYKKLAQKYMDGYDEDSWREILTIASIIQKETHVASEMPLISSVIQNRLSRGMKLQLDATLNYGKYSHSTITPARIANDKSSYNTYLHKGLPPHPIGSASIDAIMAALRPANSDYLYFMLAEDGSHNFAITYKEHRHNIEWYNKHKISK